MNDKDWRDLMEGNFMAFRIVFTIAVSIATSVITVLLLTGSAQ